MQSQIKALGLEYLAAVGTLKNYLLRSRYTQNIADTLSKMSVAGVCTFFIHSPSKTEGKAQKDNYSTIIVLSMVRTCSVHQVQWY
jgi:hypothetical protein